MTVMKDIQLTAQTEVYKLTDKLYFNDDSTLVFDVQIFVLYKFSSITKLLLVPKAFIDFSLINQPKVSQPSFTEKK